MSQSSSCLTPAEYLVLAEKLQNVAQSLLAFSTAQTPDIFSDLQPNTCLLGIPSDLPPQVPVSADGSEVHSFNTDRGKDHSIDAREVHSVDAGEAHSVGAGEAHSVGAGEVHSVGAGEVRSFFFPAPAIQLERDLLQKHRTESFQGLLEEVHALLIGLVKLMQSVHKDVRFRGHIIISLGMQLSHASSLVLRMRTIYDKVVLVQKKNK